jgi:F-type H+-transporting ATPase subunit b
MAANRGDGLHRVRGAWLRAGCFGLLLAVTMPATSAFADEHEEADEAAEEAHGDGHHGGPIHLRDVLTNPEFGAAAINFVLLLIILVRFGKRPVASFLGDRRRIMERSMNEAAEHKAKAEKLHKEYSDRLAQLDRELQKLRDDIARSAQEDKQRIVADAEETAQRLRSETEALIDQHRKALTADVRRDVVEAAAAAAEQVLRGQLTPGDQQRLADVYVQRVGSTGAAKPTGGNP